MTSKALEAAHAARKARIEAGETIERLDPLEKARRNPSSLRLAINAKCFSCQGEDGDPGVRIRIRECAVAKCPLNPVRPYQRDESEAAE